MEARLYHICVAHTETRQNLRKKFFKILICDLIYERRRHTNHSHLLLLLLLHPYLFTNTCLPPATPSSFDLFENRQSRRECLFKMKRASIKFMLDTERCSSSETVYRFEMIDRWLVGGSLPSRTRRLIKFDLSKNVIFFLPDLLSSESIYNVSKFFIVFFFYFFTIINFLLHELINQNIQSQCHQWNWSLATYFPWNLFLFYVAHGKVGYCGIRGNSY